jgi:hypothetical protein
MVLVTFYLHLFSLDHFNIRTSDSYIFYDLLSFAKSLPEYFISFCGTFLVVDATFFSLFFDGK